MGASVATSWGSPLCLLTTTGRRAGCSRTSPLIFMADGARVVLVASQGSLRTTRGGPDPDNSSGQPDRPAQRPAVAGGGGAVECVRRAGSDAQGADRGGAARGWTRRRVSRGWRQRCRGAAGLRRGYRGGHRDRCGQARRGVHHPAPPGLRVIDQTHSGEIDPETPRPAPRRRRAPSPARRGHGSRCAPRSTGAAYGAPPARRGGRAGHRS